MSGRFHRWQATAFTGADLDEVSVRMAVDSTSPDQLKEAAQAGGHDLFSFRSSDLQKANAALYRAKGDLVTSVGSRPLEVQIDVPEGHNAFFLLSFTARRSALGEAAWAELVTGGSGSGGIDAERRLDPWANSLYQDLAAA